MSESCSSSCSSCSSASSCGGSCPSGAAAESQKTQAQQLSNIKNVIVVMSGKGGVGKSSFSSLIAIALQKMGKKVGILDGDITGPSIPKLFGVKGLPEVSEYGAYPLKSKGSFSCPATRQRYSARRPRTTDNCGPEEQAASLSTGGSWP